MTANAPQIYIAKILKQKRLDSTNKYLRGLGLEETKSPQEERAALNAWHLHDAVSGAAIVAVLAAAVATLFENGWVGGFAVAGAVIAGFIQASDAKRVMANAVLDLRDKPRPSLDTSPLPAETPKIEGHAMTHNSHLSSVIASVRPALKAQPTTEAERAQFLYDLVREVYDHAKFDLHGPTEDTDERSRIGKVADAALPRR